jgi:hypothetical protein
MPENRSTKQPNYEQPDYEKYHAMRAAEEAAQAAANAEQERWAKELEQLPKLQAAEQIERAHKYWERKNAPKPPLVLTAETPKDEVLKLFREHDDEIIFTHRFESLARALGAPTELIGDGFGGYRTEVNIVFDTWHRSLFPPFGQRGRFVTTDQGWLRYLVATMRKRKAKETLSLELPCLHALRNHAVIENWESKDRDKTRALRTMWTFRLAYDAKLLAIRAPGFCKPTLGAEEDVLADGTLLADIAGVCQGLRVQMALLQGIDTHSIFTKTYALPWCWKWLHWDWQDQAQHEARIDRVLFMATKQA